MKKQKALVIAFLMMVSLIGGVLTGCGSPSVNLNDYVKITTSGYDGYGTLSASVDTDQLIEDYSDYLTDKSLDTQYFGNQTPALAADFVFSNYDPYELAYEAGQNLKNGDEIEFTWNTSESAIKTLKSILKVNIKYKDFTHTVTDLETLVECDPFENVKISYSGRSGVASVDEYADNKAIVTVGDKEIGLAITSEEINIANGDEIHIELTDVQSPEYYAENYGLVLTRTEADIIAENVDYMPQENPEEIFQYITEKSYENVVKALEHEYGKYAGEMQYECVGAVYYYNDGEIDYSVLGSNKNNLLALIYRLDNGIYPGGWYTFIAPEDTAIVRHIWQEDGTLLKTTTFSKYFRDDPDDALSTWAGNYIRESTRYYGMTTYFEYEGLYYAGHKTLQECIDALNDSKTVKNFAYDHLVVTDSLAGYVTEY